MTLVSIIIPTFNHARFVAQAVDCALAQTHRELEVLVVDDGSTDDTAAVLAPYAGRITLIRKANGGLSSARNAGLAAARGAYVLFLDADDLIPPDKLAVQAPVLDAQPELGLVYCAWQYVDETATHVLGEFHAARTHDVLAGLLRREFFFPVSAALVRRACFDAVGLFDETLRAAEDMDMWVRIAHAGFAFGYVDQVLFQYRRVAGSMSSRFANQARYELQRLDQFFAQPNLAPAVAALKPQAYAAIHCEYGAKYIAAGEHAVGREHLQAAMRAHPQLLHDTEWLLGWVSGFALDLDAGEAEATIAAIVSSLPLPAERLRSLRRRALGRYHAAALFSAHADRRLPAAKAHVLPAIWGEPRLLTNRGFVKIAVRALRTP